MHGQWCARFASIETVPVQMVKTVANFMSSPGRYTTPIHCRFTASTGNTSAQFGVFPGAFSHLSSRVSLDQMATDVKRESTN